MSEPDKAAKNTQTAYKTLYSKRLKNRCRPNFEEIQKIAKINTPKHFKAKIKLNPPKTVSKNCFRLTPTNPGVSEPSQGGPLDKNLFERPLNDPQRLGEQANNIHIILTDGDSDELEFHDSSDATMDSQDDGNSGTNDDNSQNKNKTGVVTENKTKNKIEKQHTEPSHRYKHRQQSSRKQSRHRRIYIRTRN